MVALSSMALSVPEWPDVSVTWPPVGGGDGGGGEGTYVPHGAMTFA